MNKLWAYIASFYKPPLITFYLKVDEDAAILAIEKFTKENSSSWFPDIIGSFVINGNFEFYLVTPVNTGGVRYNSKFKGKICSNINGKAIVEAQLKPAPGLYVLICVATIHLIICIIELFSKPHLISSFLLGLIITAVLFAIPFFIYHISNSSTIERFKSFLKTEGMI